jgi:hypothetical protein
VGEPLLFWQGDTINSLIGRSKDDIIDPAEVAKKNKIEWSADALAHQTETEKDKLVCNDVKREMCVVDETIETKEVKQDDGVATQSQNLQKKVSAYCVSKGRGVTESKRDRDQIMDTVDSEDSVPFLNTADGAGQTCGNTKGASAIRSRVE